MQISCGMTTTIKSDTSYQNFAVLWGVHDSTDDCCHAVTRSTAGDEDVLRVLFHRLRHTTAHRRNHCIYTINRSRIRGCHIYRRHILSVVFV